MQILEKNIINNCTFAFICVLLSFLPLYGSESDDVLFAKKDVKELGMVKIVSGNVFLVSRGKLKKVKVGDVYFVSDEFLTEEGAQVTFSDYYDHKYHLSGSGHLQMYEKSAKLLKGYVWLQSFHQGEAFSMKTANATIRYSKGEGIFSFDHVTSKTQLLVVSGSLMMANLLRANLWEKVGAGQFSFVDKDYNEGIPRRATYIGEQSFNKVTGLFKGVGPIFKQNIPDVLDQSEDGQYDMGKVNGGRSIASIERNGGKGHGKMQKGFDLQKFYSQKVSQLQKKRSRGKRRLKKTGVKLRIFGLSKTQNKVVKARKSSLTQKQKKASQKYRAPASVRNYLQQKNKSVDTNEFEAGLKNEYDKQKRHSNEVNSLIKDLKSYRQDYSTAY